MGALCIYNNVIYGKREKSFAYALSKASIRRKVFIIYFNALFVYAQSSRK